MRKNFCRLSESQTSEIDPPEGAVQSTSSLNELEELRQQLERRDSEIRKLQVCRTIHIKQQYNNMKIKLLLKQEEKQSLENDLQQVKVCPTDSVKEGRDPRSVLSSPIGSMDSLRKVGQSAWLVGTSKYKH